MSYAQPSREELSLLVCNFRVEQDPWLALKRRCSIRGSEFFPDLGPSKDRSGDDVLGHDLHLTVGSNIGTLRSLLPTLGIDWRPIWNPVITDWWKPEAPRSVTASRR
jgi:hypothetical protein